uniref:Uncharacterized protein n=1 Tax=Arundo donax TaxID=35708 RepID=A0A0A8ZIW7_ARUDO
MMSTIAGGVVAFSSPPTTKFELYPIKKQSLSSGLYFSAYPLSLSVLIWLLACPVQDYVFSRNQWSVE